MNYFSNFYRNYSSNFRNIAADNSLPALTSQWNLQWNATSDFCHTCMCGIQYSNNVTVQRFDCADVGINEYHQCHTTIRLLRARKMLTHISLHGVKCPSCSKQMTFSLKVDILLSFTYIRSYFKLNMWPDIPLLIQIPALFQFWHYICDSSNTTYMYDLPYISSA